jgi:mono/diheme cytochrome c family protein
MARQNPRPRPRFRISWRRALWRVVKIGAVIAVIVFGWQVYAHLFQRATTTFSSDEEFFKYGGIGNENDDGLPHKIWAVLPKVCPKLIDTRGLPEGREYEAFGFLFEDGRDHPIGFAKTRIGFDRVAINCAVCHSQRYKLPGAEPVTVIGGAANRLDSMSYLRFISNCVGGPDFTADNVIAAVEERFPETTWFESFIYRTAVIPMMRDAVQKTLTERYAWTWDRPAWGPGRVDPFNPVKFDYLRQPIDNTVGNSDMMLIWNTKQKIELAHKLHGKQTPVNWHWDGLSVDLWEVILNSAFGDGTRGAEFDRQTFERIARYLEGLRSPAAPMKVDAALRSRGEALFNRDCASCHGENGRRTLTLIPKDEIGTDDNRLKMWTSEATTAYNAYYDPKCKGDGDPSCRWTFSAFRNNEAYLAQPLWGIWLAGPYLHNGSVPTLDDLLKPPAERPRAFVRGLEDLDLVRGGYVAPPCDPASHRGPGFCYDTSQRGNSPQGHNYGTALSADERRALVHYLLTL